MMHMFLGGGFRSQNSHHRRLELQSYVGALHASPLAISAVEGELTRDAAPRGCEPFRAS